MRWHGIPLSIIFYREAQFTSHFWRSFQKSLGTHVKLSTAFHPQTNRQAERTIQTLEEMLRACVMDFKGSSDDHSPLIEFFYNNSYYSTIVMAPFEALYGKRCTSSVGWFEVEESSILFPEIIHEVVEKVRMIKDRLATAYSHQKSNADNRKRALEFEVGDQVYLKISPMKGVMRFGKKGKLSPRYIGLYEVLQRVGNGTYKLKLPMTCLLFIQCFIIALYELIRVHAGIYVAAFI